MWSSYQLKVHCVCCLARIFLVLTIQYFLKSFYVFESWKNKVKKGNSLIRFFIQYHNKLSDICVKPPITLNVVFCWFFGRLKKKNMLTNFQHDVFHDCFDSLWQFLGILTT